MEKRWLIRSAVQTKVFLNFLADIHLKASLDYLSKKIQVPNNLNHLKSRAFTYLRYCSFQSFITYFYPINKKPFKNINTTIHTFISLGITPLRKLEEIQSTSFQCISRNIEREYGPL